MPSIIAEEPATRLDFAEIKSKVPIESYCRQRGIVLYPAGRYLRGKCPVHHEYNGNAFIIDPQTGRAYCNGKCKGAHPKGWDVVDLEATLSGSSQIDAATRLSDMLPDYIGITPMTVIAAPAAREILKPTKENPFALPYIPTREQLSKLRDNSHRLLQPGAIELFLAKPEWAERGWRPETIRALALDGYLGIQDDATTFHYASCCKVRWTERGERQIRFRFGKPWLWRGELIPESATVVIVEGEPDAISLIDAGFESEGVVVICLPASSFSLASWKFLFAGKDVVIIPDDDQAGSDAAIRTKQELTDRATSVRTMPLNELLDETL